MQGELRYLVWLLGCLSTVRGFGHTDDVTIFDGLYDVTPPFLDEDEAKIPKRPVSGEQRLMRDLTTHYERSVRPVFDASQPVVVNLGLTLTQILDLDEKNQVLTTNVWLEAEWYDQRLKWNSSDYEMMTSIRIPCDRLWLPDIVLYNSVDDYTSGYMPSLAMVYNNSRVFWGPVVRFRSSCKIDITYFPFDDQVCRLKLGSWAYNGFQVDVWNRSHTMDLTNYVDNGEWELIGLKVERNVVYYACCDEPFPDVTFYLRLRRRVKYYFMNIIIPCIILSFLCLAGFLLPPESGEKITLGLSVLLTITVFMLMVADKMPQTSESISVISIYLMIVLTTSCLSVLSSVLVLSIHHQRGRPKRVPQWVKLLIFRLLTPALCIHLTSDSASDRARRRKLKQARDRKSPRRGRVAMEESEFIRMDPNKAPLETEVTSGAHPGADNWVTTKPDPWRLQQTDGWSKGDNWSGTVVESRVHFSTEAASCGENRRPTSKGDDRNRTPKGDNRIILNKGENRPLLSAVDACRPTTDNSCRSTGDNSCTTKGDNLATVSRKTKQTGSVPPKAIPPPQLPSEAQRHLAAGEPTPTGTELSGQQPGGDNPGTSHPGCAACQPSAHVAVVRSLIGVVQQRHCQELEEEDVLKEWRDVALVIDRLLFITFLLTTVVSTFLILEMRPPEVAF